ncbi:unnamed protein product, partial [Ectocarpus sp. 8 AP-2014]
VDARSDRQPSRKSASGPVPMFISSCDVVDYICLLLFSLPRVLGAKGCCLCSTPAVVVLAPPAMSSKTRSFFLTKYFPVAFEASCCDSLNLPEALDAEQRLTCREYACSV